MIVFFVYNIVYMWLYICEVNLLKIENGWNIAGEDIAEEERTEGKDSATNKIWMAKRWEYIHREYEYLNSGFFFLLLFKGQRCSFPAWILHLKNSCFEMQIKISNS